MIFPAETAPKNRVILGDFGFFVLQPTVWNPVLQQWCIAILDAAPFEGKEGESQGPSFANEYADPSRLKGWLPMRWVEK